MEGFLATFWPYSLAAFLLAFFCNGFFVHYQANLFRAKVDKRRHHTREVSLLGGVAVLLGLIPAGFAYVWNNPGAVTPLHPSWLLGAFVVAAAVGLADDRWELRARWKFLGHLAITACLWAALRDTETPVDRLLGSGSAASNAVEVFWCLGTLNSINLIDGLDGLASGIGMLVIGFLCLTNTTDPLLAHTLLLLSVPALLGFFFWNRNPARIFLGEAGALSVGILLFTVSMNYKSSGVAAVDMVVPLFAHGVPIFDTLMAMIRRISRGTGLMAADREHIHHRLLRLGLSHRNTVRLLHAITLYLCLIGYQFTLDKEFRFSALALVLLGIGINLVLLMVAEKKLYSYLTNFASHMLKLLDENRQSELSSQVRMRVLHEHGVPFMAFSLNLENCVKTLLEKSPGRIQVFYSALAEALRNDYRELHYESSTSAVILQKLQPGDEYERVRMAVLIDLAIFEKDHKLDLYLHLRSTLRYLPPDERRASPASPAAAERAKKPRSTRRVG